MTTAIDYALMAGHAYRTTRDQINWIPAPQGWAPFFPVPDPETATIFPVTSGFEAVSFQSTTNPNEIVIAYAGTDPTDYFGDILADLALAAGILSAQLRQAADYYLAVKASVPASTTITFTGHSLGGGLASLMAVMFGESAVTFDQAPFLNSARTFVETDFYGNQTSRSVAQRLRDYLGDRAPATLLAYIAANDPLGSNPNPPDTLAVRNGRVSNINVDGEFLTSWFLVPSSNRIGSQSNIANSNAGVGGIDLHSQALLAAFLQSEQTATTVAGQKQSFSEVTFKLTELLKMIYDKTLYSFDTDKNRENFLEHIVRHQTGNVAGVAPTGDAMVTRFTRDLWKIAQDNGLTLTNKFISKALTAFAMQMYYEGTDNAKNANKTLFTDVNGGGIQFDMADVAAKFQTAFNAGKALDLDDAKGALHVRNYIETAFLEGERQLINSLLPILRDWTIQAGTSAINTADTQNRNAFLLGGAGSDGLVGGSGTDLLVGNGGADLLQGKSGNDILLGGAGDDTYVYTAGDGLDTLLDTAGQNILAVDGDLLTGGAQYGDAGVHRSTDGKHLYVRPDANCLLIDGNLLIRNYGTGGSFGLTLTGAANDQNPQTIADITGDVKPSDTNGGLTGIQAVRDAQGKLIGTTQPYEDILVGTTGSEHILGGELDDNIGGRGSNDWIEGGAGQDYVNGEDGNDLIEGGIGSDILLGDANDDRIYGGTRIGTADAVANGRNDTASGAKGDWLTGNSGDDTIVAGADNDVLTGGSGRDLLVAGAGDDFILGDADYTPQYILESSPRYTEGGINWYHTSNAPFAWAVTPQGASFQFAPVTGETRPADGGADVIYAGKGKDYAWGGLGNDAVFGEEGEDTLYGEDGNDILLGGGGVDHIYGDGDGTTQTIPGNDYLSGGEGIDHIWGMAGDDIIIGGSGNDIVVGGTGRDTYFFNQGDGVDEIWDDDTGSENSILVFGEGFDQNTIKLRPGSLMLDMGNGDAIHIENFDSSNPLGSQSFAAFQFADGSSLSWGELLSRGFDIDGTAGADVPLFGTGVDDRIRGFGGNDQIYGITGRDSIDGGSGNDMIDSADGNDTLSGGAGNDTITANGNDNVLIYQRGDGFDQMKTGGTGNVLRLGPDIAAADLKITLDTVGARALLLEIGVDPSDKIRFSSFDAVRPFAQRPFDLVEFSDGSTLPYADLLARGFDILGTGLGETITGSGAGDRISGGRGDDYLDGGLGNDTYLFSIGDGEDSIDEYASYRLEEAPESSVIRFGPGITSDNITMSMDGGDLRFQVRNTSSSIFYFSDYEARLSVEFADGAVWQPEFIMDTIRNTTGTIGDDWLIGTWASDIVNGGKGDDVFNGAGGSDHLIGGDGADWFNAGSGDDILDGGAGSDYYVLRRRGGNDLVLDFDKQGEVDGIGIFSTISRQQIRYTRNTGDGDALRISVDGADASITIDNWFSRDATSRVESFYWAADQSYWNSSQINSAVWASNAAPLLQKPSAQVRALSTFNLALADIMTDPDGDRLLYDVSLADGSPLPGWISFDPYAGILTGTPASMNTGKVELLIRAADAGGRGMSAHFELNVAVEAGVGGLGNDTFLFNPGDGVLHISDSGGNDTLAFGVAINPEAIKLGLGSLMIRTGTENDAIHIDQFDPDAPLDNPVVERFSFADGTVLSYEVLLARGFDIDGDGEIRGTALADRITGSTGNDTLRGGSGDDVINGGQGDDTYQFSLGNGVDAIVDAEGLDQLVFGTGISVAGATASRTNSRVTIFASATDSVSFDETGPGQYAVEKVVFEDGVWQASDIQLRVNSTPSGDVGIGGTAIQGQILTASNTLADADGLGSIGYQWQSSSDRSTWTDIAGATEDKFTLGSPQVGQQVRVIASYTDGHGTVELVNSMATAAVINPNRSPTLATGLADQLATEGILFTCAIPLGTFADIDVADALTYTATLIDGTALPSWLAFNAATQMFNGTPTLTSPALLNVRVTATDPEGASVADDFVLDIANRLVGTDAVDNLSGTSLRDVIEGLAGNDALNGGAGADTLIGGLGNDIYMIDNAGDVVVENAGEGTDRVLSSISCILGGSLENLTLSGNSAIDGTGNALDNVLIGNGGSNRLFGGEGNDSLTGYSVATGPASGNPVDYLFGGSGNDVYSLYGNGVTQVIELELEGVDLVLSSTSYALTANVENLILVGGATNSIGGSGNELDNALTGNDATNTLTGNAGDDTLDGKGGADMLDGGIGNDAYLIGRGYGSDTVRENDATVGNADEARFLTGVAADQIWLRHVGNHLEASIIGTTDKLTVENWYLGFSYHVEQFKTADGRVLVDSQVENLVQAMAAFAPPAPGQTSLPGSYQEVLTPVIAANWQ